MPQIMQVAEEWIANTRKKDSIWMVFHKTYNDIHALHIKPTEEMRSKYLDKNETDNKAREEFLDYMKTNFADIKLVEIGDLVAPNYLQFPYLGSIGIDADIDSDVYVALCEKYNDAFKDPTVNNAVLWVMEYTDAVKWYKKREEYWEDM